MQTWSLAKPWSPTDQLNHKIHPIHKPKRQIGCKLMQTIVKRTLLKQTYSSTPNSENIHVGIDRGFKQPMHLILVNWTLETPSRYPIWAFAKDWYSIYFEVKCQSLKKTRSLIKLHFMSWKYWIENHCHWHFPGSIQQFENQLEKFSILHI